MSKIKEILYISIFAIINIITVFLITYVLGISNIVIFTNYALTLGDITWEFLFFIILSLLETCLYEYYITKN